MNYYDQEYLIDSLLNDMIDESTTKKREHLYNYVKLPNQTIIHTLLNYIYYILTIFKLIQFKKSYHVQSIFCKIDNQSFKLRSNLIYICDNCIKLNNIIIPYEYVEFTKKFENKFFLKLIPNERNVNQIEVDVCNFDIYKNINSNMNYHMRYNKLNNNAIKYYQKFKKTPIEVY
jgi:hypothetical protein